MLAVCINPHLAGLNRNIQNRKPIIEEKTDPLQKAWQNVTVRNFLIFLHVGLMRILPILGWASGKWGTAELGIAWTESRHRLAA